jgi:hypothetical protein
MKRFRWMLLMAAVLFSGSSCARPDWIERTLVTVDVTGAWSGEVAQSGSHRELFLELKQEGSKVTGNVRLPFFNQVSGPIEGTVMGDRFEFFSRSNVANLGISGEMTVSGDEMKGRADGGLGRGLIFLRRVDSSSRPSSP